MDLQAIWVINYSYAIQFDPNGATDGEYDEVYFIKDKNFTEVELPKPTLVKDNLVFKGWCVNANGKDYTYNSPYPAGEAIKSGDSYFNMFKSWLISKANVLTNYTATLYAVYGEPESEKTEFKYNIIFSSDGHDGNIPEAIGFDDFKTASFKFPENTFTVPSGYVFAGWKANALSIVNLGNIYTPGTTWTYKSSNETTDQITYNFVTAEKYPRLYEPTVTLTPVFVKPYGSLKLSNNSGVAYTIFVDGVSKGYLDNGESATIDELSLNEEHTVEIYKYDKDAKTYSLITGTTSKFTFTKAGETQTFSFPKLATVKITHSYTSTYKVYIDDNLVATWTKSGTYSFDVSPNVQHKLYVKQQDGYIFNPTEGTKNFTLEPDESISYSGPSSSTSTVYFK